MGENRAAVLPPCPIFCAPAKAGFAPGRGPAALAYSSVPMPLMGSAQADPDRAGARSVDLKGPYRVRMEVEGAPTAVTQHFPEPERRAMTAPDRGER